MLEERKSYDETIKVIFTNAAFNNYLFYIHILSQCHLKFETSSDFIAGVSINDNKYTLHINPIKFELLEIKERIGVLKHEVLHIINLHLTERKIENHEKWNLATDCAINQLIDETHLPKGHITINNLFEKNKNKIKHNERAEYYYSLIEDTNEKNYNRFDKFEKSDSKMPDDTIKDITKGMIDTAVEETIKTAGVDNVPKEVNKILKLLYSKEINWKREIQKIVSSLKAGSKRTIMKPNRRNPYRKDLKGKVKDSNYEILVITDESASVSNKQEIKALSEIISLCDMLNTEVDIIRVDTEASEITKLNKKNIEYTRIKNGATFLSKSIEKIKKNYDIIIILTDGELLTDDIDNFYQLNTPIIWLVINSVNISGLDRGKMKKIQIYKI